VQDQPQIGAGEGAVGGLEDDDLVVLRREFRHDPALGAVLRQQQIVEAGLLLAQRAVAPVLLEAGDAVRS
jgi:hypothetical protein